LGGESEAVMALSNDEALGKKVRRGFRIES
jgi:hypothetical protein